MTEHENSHPCLPFEERDLQQNRIHCLQDPSRRFKIRSVPKRNRGDRGQMEKFKNLDFFKVLPGQCNFFLTQNMVRFPCRPQMRCHLAVGMDEHIVAQGLRADDFTFWFENPGEFTVRLIQVEMMEYSI